MCECANSTEQNKQLYFEFADRFAQYTGNAIDNCVIDVEFVGNCADRLKKDKVAGIDCLTAEH